ncbi:MAG: transposase [Verrucomicrobia bacterium]|nr:transposase [Verrucomicrobiota bacterium]
MFGHEPVASGGNQLRPAAGRSNCENQVAGLVAGTLKRGLALPESSQAKKAAANENPPFVVSIKSNPTDGVYYVENGPNHHAKLPRWSPEDSPTRTLRQLAFHRRALVDERTALTNRLIALLKQYFPQALALCGEDLWRPLATSFLLKWPSLQAAQKARPASLKTFYYLNGSRSQSLMEERLALVGKAVPVTDETGILGSFAQRVQLICRQLQLTQRTIHQFDRQVADAYAAHPDHDIFASLPGAGPVLGVRLLTTLGAQRERFGQNAAQLQCYTGVAPVTKKSGGSCRIHRRYRVITTNLLGIKREQRATGREQRPTITGNYRAGFDSSLAGYCNPFFIRQDCGEAGRSTSLAKAPSQLCL